MQLVDGTWTIISANGEVLSRLRPQRYDLTKIFPWRGADQLDFWRVYVMPDHLRSERFCGLLTAPNEGNSRATT